VQRRRDAYWLLSQLLGMLIPHVLGGGPRLGPESTREANRAIDLDPGNAQAPIARARLLLHAFDVRR